MSSSWCIGSFSCKRWLLLFQIFNRTSHVDYSIKFGDDAKTYAQNISTQKCKRLETVCLVVTQEHLWQKNIDEAVDQRRKQLSVTEKVKDIFLYILQIRRFLKAIIIAVFRATYSLLQKSRYALRYFSRSHKNIKVRKIKDSAKLECPCKFELEPKLSKIMETQCIRSTGWPKK